MVTESTTERHTASTERYPSLFVCISRPFGRVKSSPAPRTRFLGTRLIELIRKFPYLEVRRPVAPQTADTRAGHGAARIKTVASDDSLRVIGIGLLSGVTSGVTFSHFDDFFLVICYGLCFAP